MAITARFEADFASFNTAVETADVKLRSFESGANKVESALSRMTDSFSGRKVIQDAELMASAVERVGGVSKLTEAELAKVSGTAREAAEKLTKMGVDVPPGIQKIADASEATFTAFLEGIPVVGQFIALLSVEKLGEFALAAISAADHIDDIAVASGLSREAIQKFTFVAAAFGVDMDEIAKGVEQLSARLANGDKSAVAAVQGLGLSVKALINSGPEAAFLTIADAAGKLEDPMIRGGVAADLFGGKLGRTLLPVLGDLRKRMEEVPKDAVISDANIEAASRFDDAIHQAEIRAKALAVNIATLPIHIFEAYSEVLKGASEDELQAAIGARGFSDAQTNVNTSVKAGITAADLMKNTLIAWRKEGIEPLTSAQTAAIVEGEKFGKSQTEIAKAVGASEVAVHQYLEAQRLLAVEMTKEEETFAKVSLAVGNLQDLMGRGQKGLTATVAEAATEFLRLGGSQSDVALAFNLTAGSVKVLADELAKATVSQKMHLEATNAAVVAEFNARVANEAAMGREADGTLKVAGAMETYRLKLVDINALKAAGVPVTEQLAQAERDLVAGFAAEAEAANKVLVVGSAVSASISSTAQSFDGLTVSIAASADEMARFYAASALGSNVGTPGANNIGVPGAGGAGNLAGDFLTNIGILHQPTHRAGGGPVSAGGSYMVGENGPELFTPGAGGMITPNGGGPTVNNYFTIIDTAENVARRAADLITRSLKQGMSMRAA